MFLDYDEEAAEKKWMGDDVYQGLQEYSNELNVDLLEFVEIFHAKSNFLNIYKFFGFILNQAKKGYVLDIQSLSNELGLGLPTIKKCVRKLKEHGYIDFDDNDRIVPVIKKSITDNLTQKQVFMVGKKPIIKKQKPKIIKKETIKMQKVEYENEFAQGWMTKDEDFFNKLKIKTGVDFSNLVQKLMQKNLKLTGWIINECLNNKKLYHKSDIIKLLGLKNKNEIANLVYNNKYYFRFEMGYVIPNINQSILDGCIKVKNIAYVGDGWDKQNEIKGEK